MKGKHKGYIPSKETRLKISIAQKGKTRVNQRGENSAQWKGNKLGYSAAHSYLRKYHTDKKDKCEHCASVYKLQFAKKKNHNYTRNIEDYLILCSKCHLVYDGIKERAPWNKGNVAVYPKKCEYCEKDFNGKKKASRFCSGVCSGRWRFQQGLTKIIPGDNPFTRLSLHKK